MLPLCTWNIFLVKCTVNSRSVPYDVYSFSGLKAFGTRSLDNKQETIIVNIIAMYNNVITALLILYNTYFISIEIGANVA